MYDLMTCYEKKRVCLPSVSERCANRIVSTADLKYPSGKDRPSLV